MKRIYLLYLLLLLQATAGHAQDSSQNYILTRTMFKADTKSYLSKVVYYDGIGRPFQTVSKAIENTYKKGVSLATLQEYDTAGRETKAWLPAVIASDYLAPANFKSSAPGSHGNDSRPYQEAVYEASPQNRIVKQYGAGADWYSGHSVATEFMGNSATAQLRCAQYKVTSASALEASGDYANGTLNVTRTTDEDGNVSYTFMDKIGRTLLERRMNGGETLDTYYVYDSYGNLCYVLPPAINGNISTDNLNLYAYQYGYDGFNRCIWKKLPGAGKVEYTYNDADQLTFSQDGNQTDLATKKWTYYLYDKYGRLTQQGECTNKSATSNAVVHIQNYYDDYTAFRTATGNNSNYPDETSGRSKGYLTGSIVTVLGSNTQINKAYYYDINGRMTKIVQNNLMGGFDITETSYSFSGKPTRVEHRHTKETNGSEERTEVYTYSYDHYDRLQTVSHKLDAGSPVIIVNNTYNDLGQLKKNSRTNAGALTENYEYNIRGWLTRLYGTQHTEDLTYSYNGNITSMQWELDGTTRKYTYSYDQLSRLTGAVFSGGSDTERYNTAYTYDKNGNIKTLTRYGKTTAAGTNGTYGLIDNLTMTYNGNQLTNVTDAGVTVILPESNDFKKGSTANPGYEYDKNGNMTKDLNKKITGITYNSLSLPQTVSIDGTTHTYTYAADGTKLKVKQGNLERTYAGNFIYEGSSLKRILIEGGYIEGNTYYFYFNDHLGNVRTVTDVSGNAIQRNHYYPFGLPMAESTDANQNEQPYKYNGKEFERKDGLNWMDYGARHYDAALGRFTTIDPLSEKYYAVSPYAYCLNNPVKFIDPTGKEVVTLDEESRRNIINTLTKKEAKYVKFEKNGTLNVSRLNKSKSKSENMLALKKLANSETTYNFSVTDKDIEGEAFSQTYKGLTAIPGEDNKPSPDGNVWIQTSSFLDEKGQAQNVVHEAYGHAYFYDLNKTDKSYDYHHRYQNVAGEAEWDAEFNIYIVPNIRTETNLKLKKQIEIVTKQTKKNYDDKKK